jgi:hemerythrin superfamily protein
MDAITLLKADHKTVKLLFTKFTKLGDNAHKSKRDVVDQIIEELSVHASIEELVFYPAVRKEVEGADDDVLEALEEHHVAKWLLSELDGMDPTHERFDAKVKVLIESVKHHIEEEETQLFPEVRQALGRKHLQELGEELEKAKKVAPTRPHPRTPDEPPGNPIVAPAAGLADRALRAVGKGRRKAG